LLAILLLFQKSISDYQVTTHHKTYSLKMSSFEGINGAMANELNQLSDTDKRELQQFIANESQKASIQDS